MQSGVRERREERSDHTIRVSPKPNTYKAFQGQVIVWTNREIWIDAPPSLAGDVDVLDVKAIDAFPYRDTLEEFLLRPCAAKAATLGILQHVFGGRIEVHRIPDSGEPPLPGERPPEIALFELFADDSCITRQQNGLPICNLSVTLSPFRNKGTWRYLRSLKPHFRSPKPPSRQTFPL